MRTRGRITVFLLAWLTWLALTGVASREEVLTGGLVALVASLLAGHFLGSHPRANPWHKRLVYGTAFAFRFLWEMLKANLHVAWIVLHPDLPIHPGIVRIHSELTAESALTVLANAITLTPGTLTIEVNPR